MKKIMTLAAAAIFSAATYAQSVNDGVLRIKTVDGETTSVLMKDIKNITFEKLVPLTMDIEISNITKTSMDVDFIMPEGCSKYLMAMTTTEFTGTDAEVQEQIMTKYNDVFTEGKFLRMTPLTPDTQYYFYTLLIDTDGVIAGMGKAQAKTLADVQDVFTIEASDVKMKDAKVTVTPKDAETTYFVNVMSAADRAKMIEMYGDLRKGELEYLKYCAEQFNCDLDFYLSQVLNSGNYEGQAAQLVGAPLDPETEYYAICFGIDAQGNFTTDLYEQPFTTLGVTPSGNQLSVTVSNITADGCDYTVTTTNDDPYIVDMQTKAVWEKALAAHDGDAKKAAEELLKVVYQGYADNYTHTGNYSGTAENSMDDRDCVLIVCGFNGGVTTDVQAIDVKKADK